MKKILFITQSVNLDDPVLSFVHSWIEEISRYFEKVSIICLYEGRHNLPANVKIYSLGKEKGISRFKYIYHFYKYIFILRNSYEIVFVHMNQIYVVLGSFFWRSLKKKIALSYIHRQVSFSLYLAEKMADIIFTSGPESFRLKSKKLEYFGHGIDTEKFYFREKAIDLTGLIKIITVGRVTPIKHIETIIDAISILRKKDIEVNLIVIGSSVTKKDLLYEKFVREKVNRLHLEECIKFFGAINNNDLPKVYEESDISVNACPTGGLDKAVIESMSSGLVTLTSNRAFLPYFEKYGEDLIFEFENPQSLAQRIINLKNSNKANEIRNYLRNTALLRFDKKSTIKRISDKLNEL